MTAYWGLIFAAAAAAAAELENMTAEVMMIAVSDFVVALETEHRQYQRYYGTTAC